MTSKDQSQFLAKKGHCTYVLINRMICKNAHSIFDHSEMRSKICFLRTWLRVWLRFQSVWSLEFTFVALCDYLPLLLNSQEISDLFKWIIKTTIHTNNLLFGNIAISLQCLLQNNSAGKPFSTIINKLIDLTLHTNSNVVNIRSRQPTMNGNVSSVRKIFKSNWNGLTTWNIPQKYRNIPKSNKNKMINCRNAWVFDAP